MINLKQSLKRTTFITEFLLYISGPQSHLLEGVNYLWVSYFAVSVLYLKGKPGENYNVGSGINLKNIILVKKLLKLCKLKKIQIKKRSKIVFVKDRPGHDFRYALNSRKMRNKLKWRSTIKIDKGLSETIMWYQKNKRIFKSFT